MKKAAIILMGICLCLSIPVAAEAAQTSTSSVTQQSTINTTVPDTHMVTIRSEHAQVSYQHEEGDDEETQETVTYAVERFSSPQFQIQPKKGWKITAVLVNGEDVTDQLKDGMLTLPEVYEDQQIVVETEDDKKDDKKDSKDSKKGRYFKDITNSEVRALLKDVTFKIIVNKNNSERVKAATIISNNLEAIGIKTEIKDLEDDEMTKALDKKDYDLALIGCELPAVSDATYIIKQLGYDDKQLDKYLNALQNANSEDEIKSTYKTLQKYVKEKAIFISFGILDDYVVLNGRLDGELICNDFNVYRGINTIKIK